jgi:hypothetical protein
MERVGRGGSTGSSCGERIPCVIGLPVTLGKKSLALKYFGGDPQRMAHVTMTK